MNLLEQLANQLGMWGQLAGSAAAQPYSSIKETPRQLATRVKAQAEDTIVREGERLRLAEELLAALDESPYAEKIFNVLVKLS